MTFYNNVLFYRTKWWTLCNVVLFNQAKMIDIVQELAIKCLLGYPGWWGKINGESYLYCISYIYIYWGKLQGRNLLSWFTVEPLATANYQGSLSVKQQKKTSNTPPILLLTLLRNIITKIAELSRDRDTNLVFKSGIVGCVLVRKRSAIYALFFCFNCRRSYINPNYFVSTTNKNSCEFTKSFRKQRVTVFLPFGPAVSLVFVVLFWKAAGKAATARYTYRSTDLQSF